MKARRVFETILYAEDLLAAKEFYANVIGLELQSETDLLLAFRLDESVLLIFDPRKSSPGGRPVPSHGATGQGHVAFAASASELDQWKSQLDGHGVEIEKVVEWGDGSRSLYVRDPAGNSVEFAPNSLWGGGWDF